MSYIIGLKCKNDKITYIADRTKVKDNRPFTYYTNNALAFRLENAAMAFFEKNKHRYGNLHLYFLDENNNPVEIKSCTTTLIERIANETDTENLKRTIDNYAKNNLTQENRNRIYGASYFIKHTELDAVTKRMLFNELAKLAESMYVTEREAMLNAPSEN